MQSDSIPEAVKDKHLWNQFIFSAISLELTLKANTLKDLFQEIHISLSLCKSSVTDHALDASDT
jgi:hypothetical protein